MDPHTEELTQAHRAFGQAKSLYALGREAEAEAIVSSALDQIKPFEAHRLNTEMLLWRSSKRRYRGDAAGALEDVRAAQRAAARSGSPRLAVNGWLTRIDYATVAEPDERGRIEMLLEGAEIALLAAGDPPDLRATFLAAKASWLDDLGRSDEAITIITRALELAEQEHIQGINLASMYNLRGAILGAKGDLDAARVEFARSIDLRQSLAGPHAPGLSTARGNLGAMCMMQSEFACAREMFERMRESLSASGDETSASAAQLEAAFAELAYWEGHPQDSEAHARKSLSIAVAGDFDDRPFVIDARRCLLRVLKDREAWEEGATVAQELIKASDRRYRGTNQNTHALLAAANFHSASGSHETAVDLVRKARVLRAEQLEATDPRVAAIWSEEATILLAAARLDEAASALDRSEVLLASAETSTELDQLRLRFAKLQIREAQGDEEGAITDAKSLLRDLQRVDDFELLHARRLVTEWLTEHGIQPDPAPISVSD